MMLFDRTYPEPGKRDDTTGASSSSASGAVRAYTFQDGALGITLHEVRGGTRVAVETIAAFSQAESLMLPVGSMVMAVNGRSMTGLRMAAVGKALALASRPMTLMVVHPDGGSSSSSAAVAAPSVVAAAAAAAAAPSAARARPASAAPAPAGSGVQPRRRDEPGPPVDYTFEAGSMGLALQDAEGSEGGVSIREITPGGMADSLRVPVGGCLLRIAGTDASALTKAQVGKLLGKASRPLVLTICAPPPPPPVTVPFLFGDGPMGLTLIDAPDGTVCVKEVQPGGAACALQVPVGGVLRKLDAISLEGMERAVIGKLFGKVARPMSLFIEVEGDSPAALATKAAAEAEAAAAKAATAAERRRAEAAEAKSGKVVGKQAAPKIQDRKEAARAAAAKAKEELERREAEAATLALAERLAAEARAEAEAAAQAAVAAAAEKLLRLTRARKQRKKSKGNNVDAAADSEASSDRSSHSSRSASGKKKKKKKKRRSSGRGGGGGGGEGDEGGEGAADLQPGERLLELRRRQAEADEGGAGMKLDEREELHALETALDARRQAATQRKLKERPPAVKAGAADPSRELARHGYESHTRHVTHGELMLACKRSPRRLAPTISPQSPHRYEAEGPIGQGAFSTVLRARVLDGGRLVAVKSFDNAKCTKVQQMRFARDAELTILSLLKKKVMPHPHIANLVELLVGPASVHAILEYCAGGSLERELARLKRRKKELIGRDDEGMLMYRGGGHEGMAEEEVVPLAAQLASALCHLHACEIAHRDIKPGNVLYADAERRVVKLCDFGFAIRCGDVRLRDRMGTLLYQAPELVSEPPAYNGKQADMWALGATLFEMLHGKTAFHGTTVPGIEQRIRMPGGHEEIDKSFSAPARAVLVGLLNVIAPKRLRAPELIGHGWLAASAAAQGLTDHALCLGSSEPEDPSFATGTPEEASRSTASSSSSASSVIPEAGGGFDAWLGAFQLSISSSISGGGGGDDGATPLAAGDRSGDRVPRPPETAPRMPESEPLPAPTSPSAIVS